MDWWDSAPVVLFASLIPALAAFAYWWNRWGGGKRERESQERLSAERGAQARARSWGYKSHAQGDIRYRIDATSPRGLRWHIEYDTQHSKSSSPVPTLSFRVPEVNSGRLEWELMDVETFRAATSEFGAKASRLLFGNLDRFLDQDDIDYRDQSVDLCAGSSAFRQRYTVRGYPGSAAARMISDGTALRILDWPPFRKAHSSARHGFKGWQNAEGFAVMLFCEGPSFEVIEHLVLIGEAMADHLFFAAVPPQKTAAGP